MSDPRRMTKRFTVAELKTIIVRAEFDCGEEGCEDCRYERAVTQGIEDAEVLERLDDYLCQSDAPESAWALEALRRLRKEVR